MVIFFEELTQYKIVWLCKRNEDSKYSTDQIGLKTSLDKWPSLGQTGSDFAGTILWIFVRLKFLTS